MIALLLAVTLSWDWNPEPYLGGYKIYCRTEADKPVATLDVGKETKWNADRFLVGQPTGRKLFFTVRAYNTEGVEGEPSNTVSYKKTEEIIKGK